MELGWETHFPEIVVPAWQDFIQAEEILAKSGEGQGELAFAALRAGGAAAFYLHHFADIVLNERPPMMPAKIDKVHGVKEWVSEHCLMLRTEQPCDDVGLLGDIADALKHAALTQRLEQRRVAAREAVLVVKAGYGQLRFGEGRFGGPPQVIVLANDGERALSSVLQNVIDAWKRVLGLPLSEMSQP